ncbi:IS3 family transposase [Streptomyces sp. H62]
MKRLCTILGIARSSFYYWRATAADRAARQAADARLAVRIRAVHRESDGTYGVPRITAELREAGEHVNHKRIARVMRGAGLAGMRLRRRHRTTVADPAAAKAPDLISRDFTAAEPNTSRAARITADLSELSELGWPPRPTTGHSEALLAPVAGLVNAHEAGCLVSRCQRVGHAEAHRRKLAKLADRAGLRSCPRSLHRPPLARSLIAGSD